MHEPKCYHSGLRESRNHIGEKIYVTHVRNESSPIFCICIDCLRLFNYQYDLVKNGKELYLIQEVLNT